MIQNLESSILESKMLISLIFNNKKVQKVIKYLQVKIIENPKTKKLQYVIEVKNKKNKYFVEDDS